MYRLHTSFGILKKFIQEGLMSFNDLSSDVVTHIMQYVWWNLQLQQHEWVYCKDTRRNVRVTKHIPRVSFYGDREGMMKLMLVNHKTRMAIKKLRPLWIKILMQSGPKRIGPTSVHSGPTRATCKLNKDGNCRAAVHYELVPRYDNSTCFGAWEAVLEWGSKRNLNKRQAQMKRDRKRLVKYTNVEIPELIDRIRVNQKGIDYHKQSRKRSKKK